MFVRERYGCGWEAELTQVISGAASDGSVSEESAYNAGDPGWTPRSRRFPGEGNGNPLQYSCLGNPMDRGQRSLTSYSPWGCTESDMT